MSIEVNSGFYYFVTAFICFALFYLSHKVYKSSCNARETIENRLNGIRLDTTDMRDQIKQVTVSLEAIRGHLRDLNSTCESALDLMQDQQTQLENLKNRLRALEYPPLQIEHQPSPMRQPRVRMRRTGS